MCDIHMFMYVNIHVWYTQCYCKLLWAACLHAVCCWPWRLFKQGDVSWMLAKFLTNTSNGLHKTFIWRLRIAFEKTRIQAAGKHPGRPPVVILTGTSWKENRQRPMTVRGSCIKSDFPFFVIIRSQKEKEKKDHVFWVCWSFTTWPQKQRKSV